MDEQLINELMPLVDNCMFYRLKIQNAEQTISDEQKLLSTINKFEDLYITEYQKIIQLMIDNKCEYIREFLKEHNL